MIKAPDISQQLIHGNRNQALWVGSVISDVFGISSPIYLPWGANKSFLPAGFEIGESEKNQPPVYENIKIVEEQEAEAMSEFGTPVLGVVTFDSGNYNMYDRYTGELKKARYGSYTLPYSCIVEFSREANIITTNTLGCTGTVKELYGLGDWNINIRGIAVNGGNKVGANAQEQIKQLVKWSDVCDSIGVSSSLFNEKGIYNLVIKSISIQPVEAKYNVVPFQIEAVSDEPLELVL